MVLLTGQFANEDNHQPADLSHLSLDFVIGADHGQVSFCFEVKVINRKADRSIAASAICGVGEIECAKDAQCNLLALAFTSELNAALNRIINHERVQ